MPVVHKSTIKAARQAEKRRQRNRAVMTAVKGIMKKVVTAVEQQDVEAAKASLREASSAFSKAATKGVLKRNTASRRVSRLTQQVNAMTSART